MNLKKILSRIRNVFLKSKLGLSTIVSIAFITSIVIIVFNQTIFNRKPISKTYFATKVDSFLSKEPQKARIFCPIDPAIWQTQLPAYNFSDRILRTFKLPLWNPHVGAGYPHMATVDNAVFHPIRFIFPSTSEYSYNLCIVAKVLISALGTFGLIRTVGLSNLPATFGSLTYSLCPYLLEVSELSYEAWCYPLLLWLFIVCMRRRTLWSAAGLGLGCAFTVINLHPGCSVNLIASSIFISWLNCVLNRTDSKSSWMKINVDISIHLATAGFLGFCFSAPILLQYLEVFSTAWNYKLEYSGSTGVPWYSLLYLLINPGVGGSSLYLGIAAAILMPLCIVSPTKKIQTFIISEILLFMICTTTGPFDSVFKLKPFTYLHPFYFLPIYLLVSSVIASYGVNLVSLQSVRKLNGTWLLLALAFLVVLLVPALFKEGYLSFVGFRWAGTAPDFDVNINAWHRDSILASTLILFLYLGHRKLSKHMIWLGPCLCIAVSLISQVSISRLSLPTHSPFYFPPNQSVKWLQNSGARFMATGRIFLEPNLSSLFLLDDFRYSNNLFPNRYVNYIKHCGAIRSYLNFSYDNALGDCLDAAGVKYILTRTPIIDKTANNSNQRDRVYAKNELAYQGLILSKSSFTYDRNNEQITGKAIWHSNKESIERYGYQPILLDKDKKTLWIGSENQLLFSGSINGNIKTDLRYAIPLSVPTNSIVYCGLRLTNTYGVPETPVSCQLRSVDKTILLHEQRLDGVRGIQVDEAQRFKLVQETESSFRIYENTKALPLVYAIHLVKVVKSPSEALQCLSTENLHKTAIIETTNTSEIQSGSVGTGDIEPIVEFKRPDCNTVTIHANLETDGVLVIAESFHPGWRAFINGKETKVFPTNYLFKGIRLPKGKQYIEFKFIPSTFLFGLAISGSCCLFLLFHFFGNHKIEMVPINQSKFFRS